ncbi:DNA polymerase III subunit delta' [Yoonia sp. MH D7]
MSDETLPEPDRIEGAPHPRTTRILFGQHRAEADFLDAYNTDRLHSGWLITGPRGVGKATLAWKIATFLLAERPDTGVQAATSLTIPDDNPDARLVQSGAHPRMIVVRRGYNHDTKKLRQEITVDAVRGLKDFFHMSAADGGRRVVIVDSADEMNRNAANAILKELEEPPANTTILLISHQPSRLLPTIRSRCRVLRCSQLTTEPLQHALTQAGFDTANAEGLATLSEGSAGDAVRLLRHDGLALYASLIRLFEGLPKIDRPAALKLADSCAARGAETHYGLTLDLIDHFLARTARAGLFGEPHSQGSPHEARLLARLAPTDRAAQTWAQLQQDLTTRVRHGRAVNLDPASLILDMIFKIEDTARKVGAK